MIVIIMGDDANFFIAIGEFMHPCEGDMVCRAVSDKVPFFNAPVYLENKTMLGKVDEILGPINSYVNNSHTKKHTYDGAFQYISFMFVVLYGEAVGRNRCFILQSE